MKIVNIILSKIKVTDYIITVVLLFLTIFGQSINNVSAIQSPKTVLPFQVNSHIFLLQTNNYGLSYDDSSRNVHTISFASYEKVNNEVGNFAASPRDISIKITNPVQNSKYAANTIRVNGTAFSSGGQIQKVEAFASKNIFDDTFPYKLATPLKPGNWSKWSIALNVNTTGNYRVLARVTDSMGIHNWDSLTIHIPFLDGVDKFGVKEIYPTKIHGREWYVNMDNPQADKILIIDNNTLVKENDGSWRIGSTHGANIDDREFNGKFHIIIGVNTPPAQEQWKNVEITGYVKVLATSSDSESLQWYARGANHTSDAPCQGTSLKGRIHVNGDVGWVKEIWHDGGYTQENATSTATDKPLIGRWVGFKVVIYNINNDTAVKMKSYFDDKNNNHWRKVTEFTDRGGWYSDSPDNVFYSTHCGYPKDYVITSSGPIASFRSDGIVWDFKNLSVREIQPPS